MQHAIDRMQKVAAIMQNVFILGYRTEDSQDALPKIELEVAWLPNQSKPTHAHKRTRRRGTERKWQTRVVSCVASQTFVMRIRVSVCRYILVLLLF